MIECSDKIGCDPTMAVTLPSDLIADVMRFADPARLKTAAAKLSSEDKSGTAFSGIMEKVGPSSRVRDRTDDLVAEVLGAADEGKLETAAAKLGAHAPDAVAKASPQDEPYKAFEQMVLRNMFESMMPGEESGVYGGDSSAGIWRSLANDQLAGVYAEWGGLGIARTLAEPQSASTVKSDGHWPYFEVSEIRGFVG
jgi:hypothetical protein